MKEVITAIITMRIVVQFLSQAVGVIAWRYREKGESARPWRMPLFPIPAIISIAIWLFIFLSAEWYYILGAGSIISTGVVLFFLFLNKTERT
jgi:amino acid transporter